MNRTELPDDPEFAGQILQAEHQSRRLEMGLLGHWLGGSSEKPGNIAGASIIVSFLCLIAILFLGPDSTTFPKKEAVTLFGTIITGALGFLFGRSTG
jgi:hypothetical protein